ncbi:MAG TPA: hypothetical protein VIB79_29125 [Candidatus Binatia bacterium]
MFIFACIPLLFGYLVAVRILQEKQPWVRVALSYSLGLFVYLLTLNLLFHFFSLNISVCLTLGLMVLGSIPMLSIKAPPARSGTLEKTQALWLCFFCLSAFLSTLLWQMKYSDDDFFMHGPLMGLYLKDNFPPLNPYFPELAYRGHYGRDLTIASLSTLFGGNFLGVQMVITAFNQVCIILLVYFAIRRYVRSYRQAMLGMLFVFVGVQGEKSGLLEVFKNNNTFAYLLLFLNVYLYFHALRRRDIGSKIVTIVTFAVYGIVYETHYGILLISVAALPFIVAVLRRRVRARYFTVTGSIVAGSLVIALVQGGLPTDLTKRYFLKSPDSRMVTDDMRGASQEVTVRFPKDGLYLTSFSGENYSFFSRQLIREAGSFVAFLPITACLMLFLRNYFGIVISLFAILAITIPASVDFGRFNSESLRFLFFGGMSAAMLFGMTMGMAGDALAHVYGISRKLPIIVATVILVLAFEKGVERGFGVFGEAVAAPENFFFNPDAWACGQLVLRYPVDRICDPIDVAAAKKLERIVKRGDVVLDNFYNGSVAATLEAKAVLSSFSRAYVTGMGIRVSTDHKFPMGVSYFRETGFRAMAFWNTLDVDLLGQLKVDYLYVNPDNMSPEMSRKLRAQPGLQFLFKESDATSFQSREVYRVARSESANDPSSCTDLRLRSLAFPEQLQSERFYLIPIVLACGDPRFKGEAKVFYRVSQRGKIINIGDEIKQSLRLEKAETDGYRGLLYFSTPDGNGDYEVEIHVVEANGARLLRAENRPEPVTRIRIT